VIMIFLAAFGQYFPIFYLQLFAGLHGVSKKLTFYSIAVLNSTNALGRIFVCYIADCLEVVDVYIVIQFTLGLFENSRGVKWVLISCLSCGCTGNDFHRNTIWAVPFCSSVGKHFLFFGLMLTMNNLADMVFSLEHVCCLQIIFWHSLNINSNFTVFSTSSLNQSKGFKYWVSNLHANLTELY